MDDQGRGELDDFIPGWEGAGAADYDAGGQVHSVSYGFLEESGIGGEGGNLSGGSPGPGQGGMLHMLGRCMLYKPSHHYHSSS